MSPFKNKVLLKWREPRAAWKFVKKQLTWSYLLRKYLRIVVGTVAGMFVLFAAIRVINGTLRSISDLFSLEALFVGTVFGLFFCLLRWMMTISPVEIELREKNIVRSTASGTSLIPYEEVQRCTVREVEVDGQKLEILEIKDWDGNEFVLEIHPSIPGDVVLDKLREKGLQVRRGLISDV